MLYVKAAAQPSPIHGLGLFALEDIPQDKLIWQFTPGLDQMKSVKDILQLSEPHRTEILTYSCEQIADITVPRKARKGTGMMCITVGPIRYTNHSFEPNTYEVHVLYRLTRTFARRLIKVGEEITADYSLIDARWYESVSDE